MSIWQAYDLQLTMVCVYIYSPFASFTRGWQRRRYTIVWMNHIGISLSAN